MMRFEVEHKKWLESHLAKRYGERLDGLKRGHRYGNRLFVEKIWWPLVGHFSGLHPEYEINDSRKSLYYIDFVWIIGGQYFAFEIMDFGTHGLDRTKYRRDMNRALFLHSQGYRYIEISLDELKENPTYIFNMLRITLGPYLALEMNLKGNIVRKLNKTERDLLRLAIRHLRIIRPSQAARELELHRNTVIKHCRELVAKGRLRAIPSGTSGRVCQYEYIGSAQSPDLI